MQRKIHGFIIMFGLGFLTILSLGSFRHEIKEEGTLFSFVFSIFLICSAIFIARKFAKHFDYGCDHTHGTDRVFIGSILLASLIHTTFDGSILHLTQKEEGWAMFFVVLATIVIHEFIRISAIMGILGDMGYSKKQRWIYVFFVSLIGFILGIVLAGVFGEAVEGGEGFVHLATGFLYSIIATDIFLFIKNRYQISYFLVSLGAVFAIVLESLHSH